MSQYHASRPIHGLDIAHLLYSTGLDGYDRNVLIDFGPGDADCPARIEHIIHWAFQSITGATRVLRRLRSPLYCY